MADKPILFTGPNVRAILEGRKTQTRRILKPQPFSNGYRFDGRDILCHEDNLPPSALLRHMGGRKTGYTASDLEDGAEGLTGIYIGETLWVREAWRCVPHYDRHKPFEIIPTAPIQYMADGHAKADKAWGKLRPGIFMPRWASRLSLRVTGVKVERLQDISDEDAIAEGIEPTWHPVDKWKNYLPKYYLADWASACNSYMSLWESINGKDSWAANPWVAAYTFERIS